MSTWQKQSLSASWCAFHHFTKKKGTCNFQKVSFHHLETLQDKLKTEANFLCYLNTPTGLMDRQEEHPGEWGKSRKELELCCLFEIWTSWFLNANLMGAQLCPLTETRYIAIFKYKIKYIFIGKITVVHIPSGKGIVLVQSMSTRSHILLIFYFCWPFYMNKGAKNK